MALLRVNLIPSLRKHLLLVRIRQRMKRLLVKHPVHSIMLSPDLSICLISLEEEEMHSLIVRFCAEPELVLDRAKLTVQLDSADTCLLPYLPHRGRDLVLAILNQPFWQAPHSSFGAGQ